MGRALKLLADVMTLALTVDAYVEQELSAPAAVAGAGSIGPSDAATTTDAKHHSAGSSGSGGKTEADSAGCSGAGKPNW